MQPWREVNVPSLNISIPSFKVYDSKSQDHISLPISGLAKLYVCGITPYDATHMGHAATYVAFDTLKSAVSQDADVVIIDTAGRLHNKVNLMNELTKIKRVMQKVVEDSPHDVLLVLDGSTGQNAFEQAKQFSETTAINALAITKLDGTAKGGVVIGISDQMKIPVKYIGVGEGINDIQLFNKTTFVASFFK